MSPKSNSNELKIYRRFKAPLKTVWESWTHPEKAAKWWGPRGFTITTFNHDLRSGGSWKYTMHGPDGTDYPNLTRYLEVEPYQRLVYDHGGTETNPPLFRVTALFKAVGEETELDMTMSLPTPEAAAEIKKFIKKASGDSTWDRFSEYLVKETAGLEQFIINRSFAVSIDQMFDLWTQPEHFVKWMGPAGSQMQFYRAEIREGGTSFYKMTSSQMPTLHGLIHYLQLERPHRIVYTQQFCDEHENISRHPFAPIWPETMLTSVVFTSEGPARTRVTLTWQPHGKTTTEELNAFIQARTGMTQGWTGSFDRLEACIGHEI